MVNPQPPAEPAPPPPRAQARGWQSSHTFATVALAIGIAVIGWIVPFTSVRLAWALILALLIAFLLVAGDGITGRWAGVLIDERNKMSLSRFQLVLWTALLLSAFLAIAIARVREGMVADPLSIALPQELWMLMGISTASLVG